jgi:preprotein translocase SecE subunit
MADKKKTASQATETVKAQSGQGGQSGNREVPARSSKVAREERKERPREESKPVRRETQKGPSSIETWLRKNPTGRFVLEAYYELRHKVTWPTFEEARNMTFVVIALSAAIGIVLGAADYGLTQLFLLITGK